MLMERGLPVQYQWFGWRKKMGCAKVIQVSSQMNEQQLDSEEADLVEDTKFGGEED